jgi:hypothetical protein
VASLISNIDAAQPVTLAIVLPLCFLSGVFIPILELPHWLIDIGKIFPVHALADALLAAYNPHTAGSGLRWGDLAPSPPGARPDSSSPYAASAGYRAAAESLAAESLTGPAFPA